MINFEQIWSLLYDHGATDKRKCDCAALWDRLTDDQRLQLYTTISRKIREDKFLHFDPLRAMRENIRRSKREELSYQEYYQRYGTTEEKDGWRRVYLPERQTTIYVKG